MTNKNFSDMKSNVATDIQDTTSGMKTIIGRYINKRYFQVLRKINWEDYNYDYSFTLSSQDKPLPDDFYKPVYVVDTTNDKELPEVSMQFLAKNYPNTLYETGTVNRYAILEDTVKAQPSSATTLDIVSSVAGDTSQYIRVRGIDSNGIEVTETITLNGTTSVSSSNSYQRVKNLSKSDTTTGYITISAGSDTVANMPPSVTESRYKIARFHEAPDSSIEIKMPYIIKPLPLNKDEDYPRLDIVDLIELGATADAWRYKRQYSKGNHYERLFTKELGEYIWAQENKKNKSEQFQPNVYDRDSLI